MRNLTVCLAAASLMCTVSAWAAGPDELWQLTTAVEMSGMSMPPTTSTSCIAKGNNYKPEADALDKNCRVTGYRVAGDTVSWKVACTGRDAMSGTGQMTKSAKTMTGLIKMTTDGDQMTQTLSGKLVGTCTAATEHARVEQATAPPDKAPKKN